VEIIAFLRFKIDQRRHLDCKEGCYGNRLLAPAGAGRRPLAGERRWTPRPSGAGRRLRNWTRLGLPFTVVARSNGKLKDILTAK